jgi:two-component system response regulator AtoC
MCKKVVRSAVARRPNWLNHTCDALEYGLPLKVSRTLMAYVFGSRDPMKDHERRIGFIARSGLPLLIEGECGTGKEALAELVHELNAGEGEFVRILCRQTGPVVNLVAGKGNGAVDLSETYASARGTIFLKNIHVLSVAMQEQFLTALEQAAEPRNGAPAARLISSATESLEGLVSRKEFNAALYYRLSVYRIGLPPLRERLEDIPELFSEMLRRAANGADSPPPIPARMLDALRVYDWPGNLRELQNIARTFVVMGDAEEIIAELDSRLRMRPAVLPPRQASLSLKEQVKGASQKLESEIILRTLERHRWNRRRAAQSLKISYRSLLYKMKSCNLRVEAQATPEGE